MLYSPKTRIVEKRVATPEIPVAREFPDAHEQLEQKGFTYLGGGGFGSAYESPKYPGWVLKVFRDPAYLRYLSATKKSDNPHFPDVGKVYKLVEKSQDASGRPHEKIYHACFVELLSKTPDDRELDRYMPEELCNYFQWAAAKHYERTFHNKMGLYRYARIEKMWPAWEQACKIIAGLIHHSARTANFRQNGDVKKFLLHDVYPKNIMWRGNVPVITDPVWENDLSYPQDSTSTRMDKEWRGTLEA